jgi:hypothetical protein
MSDLRLAPPLPRPELRRALRAALGRLGRPLRVLAEDVAGLEGAIDLVAADPSGRVVLVLVADAGGDLELVADGLAQRAWLAPRLGDWVKLAPDLDIRPAEGIDLLLLAPEFGARARAAARAADPDRLTLARLHFVAEGQGSPRPLLERLEVSVPGGRRRGASPPPRSAFRSGLCDADLDAAGLGSR